MPVIGIVVEYNPFHNGHLYQIKKIKRLFPDSLILAVMSGCWTQRGEPALFHKWVRTEMALHNGVDLVFELPTVFAVQSAEGFARGAISILEATKVVDYLCFGSESGKLYLLQEIAKELQKEPPEFKKRIKFYLKKGYSYPRAFSASLEYGSTSHWTANKVKQLALPNNILGIEYLKSLWQINSKIKPITIKRHTSQFNDENFCGNYASASAIRKALRNGCLQDILPVVPQPAWKVMEMAVKKGLGPVFFENFATLIIGLLRREPVHLLKDLPDLEEGFYRLLYKARKEENLHSLITFLKSKRYTLTRIQRILTYLLLNITDNFVKKCNSVGPQYLRLLGFSQRGKSLLSSIKTQGALPLVTRPTVYLKDTDKSTWGKKMLLKDILATDLYFLGQPKEYKAGADYKHPLLKE